MHDSKPKINIKSPDNDGPVVKNTSNDLTARH